MRGSIIPRKRADGSTVFCIKYYDQNGKQRWETIGPNKREAERALASRIRDVTHGQLGPANRITFAEFAPTWERQKALEIRRSTMDNYKANLRNHLIPFFGEKQLRQITLGDVQQYVNSWTGDPQTLRRILAVFSSINKAAAVHGYMPKLDLSAVSKPRLRTETQTEPYQVLTVPEIEHLMSCIDERYAPDVLFLAFTGLRRGEWIALPAKHVDLAKNVVIVSQSTDRFGHIGPTKSGQGRKVAMFDRAREAYLAKLEIKADLGISDSEFAFPTPTGHMIHGSNFHNLIWKPAIKRAGFPNLRLHDLRHTAASLMIAAGAPAHFVAQQLGHTDPAFTMRAYAHWFEQNTSGVVAQMNAAFGKDAPDALTG